MHFGFALHRLLHGKALVTLLQPVEAARDSSKDREFNPLF